MNPVSQNTSPSVQAPTQPSPEMTNLIAQMHDIEAPPPVSWWPIAPGWWLIALLVCFVIYDLTRFGLKTIQHNAYRRQALSLLNTLKPSQTPEFATEVSTLLKRVALTAYPKQRSKITQAHGIVWTNWLNQACPKAVFKTDSTKALSQAPYQSNIVFDASVLKLSAKAWIKLHV